MAEGVRTVDCIGMFCPMPVLRLAKAVKASAAGARVARPAHDPAAKVDVPVWCRSRDQELLGIADRDGGGWVFTVRRAV
jgi:tRNA 2-thiouridine synthesizing protein A